MKSALVLVAFFAFLQTTTSCENACGHLGTYHPCQPGENPYALLRSEPQKAQQLASRAAASLEHLRAATTL